MVDLEPNLAPAILPEVELELKEYKDILHEKDLINYHS